MFFLSHIVPEDHGPKRGKLLLHVGGAPEKVKREKRGREIERRQRERERKKKNAPYLLFFRM